MSANQDIPDELAAQIAELREDTIREVMYALKNIDRMVIGTNYPQKVYDQIALAVLERAGGIVTEMHLMVSGIDVPETLIAVRRAMQHLGGADHDARVEMRAADARKKN